MSAPSSVDSNKKISYTQLINESVHASDDIDIGDIFAVNKDFVVVVRGYINVHYYYIPLSKIEGWDGHVLWLNIDHKEVETKYQRNIFPDMSRYYVQDTPPYEKFPLDFPEPIIITSKNKRLLHKRKESSPDITSSSPAHYHHHHDSNNNTDEKSLYKCDLCNTSFSSQKELSDHVLRTHK
jgi:hypothetical protein